MLDALGLHSKIINYQAEHDGATHVAVEVRSELTFVVSMLVKSLLENLVGQDACFRKSIHVHLDFEIDTIVVVDIAQVVFLDDIIWQDINLHLHVPCIRQWCFEVEVFKSSVMKWAPGVEMTELNRSFAVVISEVGGANTMQTNKHIATDS